MATTLLMVTRQVGAPRQSEVLTTDALPEHLAPLREIFEQDDFYSLHVYFGAGEVSVMAAERAHVTTRRPGQSDGDYLAECRENVRRNTTAAIARRGG